LNNFENSKMGISQRNWTWEESNRRLEKTT